MQGEVMRQGQKLVVCNVDSSFLCEHSDSEGFPNAPR